MKSNERFRWAADVLDVKPADHILEIGCGVGLAVEQVVPGLNTGHMTAIDRSPAMLTKASRRNDAAVKNGKASFQLTELAALPHGNHRYHKIFAFNVNLFWTQRDVAAEAKIIRSYLTRTGLLYLFYQPPDAGLIKKVKALATPNLEREGFTWHHEVYEKRVGGYCLMFRP